MIDCISRQAVLDCLTARGLKKFDFILDARDKIKNLPSVNPQEPKTGHWIKGDINEGIYCSECNENALTDYDFHYIRSNYCPNCGCRMFEPQESEG